MATVDMENLDIEKNAISNSEPQTYEETTGSEVPVRQPRAVVEHHQAVTTLSQPL